MFSSLFGLLSGILTQATGFVPYVVGFALIIAGGTLALGNHQHGKTAVALALVGGAVMLAAPTIGQALGSAQVAAAATGH